MWCRSVRFIGLLKIMLLISFKIPFLIAAIWIWNITGNEKYAAAAWATASFIINLTIYGITTSLPLYGIWAFVFAWGIFYALSFVRHSFWFWPAGFVGITCMLFFT